MARADLFFPRPEAEGGSGDSGAIKIGEAGASRRGEVGENPTFTRGTGPGLRGAPGGAPPAAGAALSRGIEEGGGGLWPGGDSGE